MWTPKQFISVRTAVTPHRLLWAATLALLATLLVLLTRTIMDDPTPSQDIAVMDWIVGWDLPGLGRFFEVVSFLTGVNAGLIYGPLGIAALGFRPGKTWSVERDGHLLHPLCRPAVEAISKALWEFDEEDMEAGISCRCPLGDRNMVFSVEAAG